MTLLPFIKQAFERSRAAYVEHALYHKLSSLEPHLLEDMGLKLENGKVVSVHDHQQEVTKPQNQVSRSQSGADFQDCCEESGG